MGGKSVETDFPPLEKWSILQEEYLLLMERGANSFFLEKIFFQKWLCVQEEKLEATKTLSNYLDP